MELVAIIPVKPFGVAKARLSPTVDPAIRSRLGRSIALRTATTAALAGATEVIIVTGDDGVANWAAHHHMSVVREERRFGAGLNGAAAAGSAAAADRGAMWALIHADLPMVGWHDLAAVFRHAASGPVIAPSHDGGTNVLVGSGRSFEFAYGPGSFHRHLRALPDACVVTRPGLAFDLDTVEDLAAMRRLPSADWLRDLLGRHG